MSKKSFKELFEEVKNYKFWIIYCNNVWPAEIQYYSPNPKNEVEVTIWDNGTHHTCRVSLDFLFETEEEALMNVIKIQEKHIVGTQKKLYTFYEQLKVLRKVNK